MFKFVVLLAALGQFTFAQERVVIYSVGSISKWCEASCQEIVETTLVEHCERGCRFFDLVQQSEMLRLNDTGSVEVCSQSCNEAYNDERNRNACVSGCNEFHKEQVKLIEAANVLHDETERQMNIISSIMEMMASAIWNPPSDNDASYEFEEDDSNFPIRPKIGLFDDSLSKLNSLEKKNDFDDEVELISLMGDELPSISEGRRPTCYGSRWLHTLSVLLVLLGSVLVISFGVCYVMALRFKKVSKVNKLSVIEASMPPSYDVAIRSEYIGLPKGIVPVHGHTEKDCKSLI